MYFTLFVSYQLKTAKIYIYICKNDSKDKYILSVYNKKVKISFFEIMKIN